MKNKLLILAFTVIFTALTFTVYAGDFDLPEVDLNGQSTTSGEQQTTETEKSTRKSLVETIEMPSEPIIGTTKNDIADSTSEKTTVSATNSKKENGKKKIVVSKPKKFRVKRISKGFKATWKINKNNNGGYILQYSTSKRFTKKTTKTVKIKNKKAKSKSIKKLKSGRKYFVRIRACKKVNNKKYYSKWTSGKGIIIK